jgi:hypothetical protein
MSTPELRARLVADAERIIHDVFDPIVMQADLFDQQQALREGGRIPGPKGQAIPILAHTGEWFVVRQADLDG